MPAHFHFLPNFYRTLDIKANSEDPDQTPLCYGLGLQSSPISHENALGLTGVNRLPHRRILTLLQIEQTQIWQLFKRAARTGSSLFAYANMIYLILH